MTTDQDRTTGEVGASTRSGRPGVDASEQGLVLQRASDALWRHTLDGVIVLSIDAPSPLMLFGPAADLWLSTAGPIRETALIEQIARAYERDIEGTQAELAPVIDQLLDLGILLDAAEPQTIGSSSE